MLIYRNTNYCYRFKADTELINKSIIKVQKSIYFFTKEYNTIKADECQRQLLLLKNEILIIILSRLIKKIKKKSFYRHFIIRNFLL